jgi:NDP-sugar pyrophosphorylase family protein
MKAMIFAAGLGTRLRPLTNDCPKALVTVAGRTLLDLTLSRLRAFGVTEVILNIHHFADKIVNYLRANQNFGMRIEISREEVLLDTGGGLKKAAWFFLESSEGAQQPFAQKLPAKDPFIVHNVDVLSNIDLAQMLSFHNEHNALATLAVQQRATSRPLLFNEQGQLCGRRIVGETETEWALPAQPVQSLAFSGIHIVSPRIFANLPEEGAFSIIPTYLRLAAEGEKILAFNSDRFYWRDLGRTQDIADAERDIASGAYPAI